MNTESQSAEIFKNECPVIAMIDDIDREFATRAFRGTSHSPEQRGQARREEYANDVNGFYAELWPLAKTAEQKYLLAFEMDSYRQGYIRYLNAYLQSHSDVVSSMIAGPANFPVARMQKRCRWADNKANDLLEWRSKARAAIKRHLLDARPNDEKAMADWRALERDLTASLSVITEIDAGKSHYTRSAFVNSMSGKVERLAMQGEIELVEKALELVREYGANHGKPAITARHKFWTFPDLARANSAQATEAATAEPETIAQADGVEIVANPQADRVQIVFAEKPSVELIGKLKAEAWKWSPNAGAWQRRLTEAAKHSAKRIVGLS